MSGAIYGCELLHVKLTNESCLTLHRMSSPHSNPYMDPSYDPLSIPKKYDTYFNPINFLECEACEETNESYWNK